MRTMLVLVILALGVLVAAPAQAGGWAVTTLDAVPAPMAGQPVEVSFTVRQHGVTPVDPGDGVGIVVRSTDAEELTFPAEPTDEPGGFVAEVTFPAEGTWTWAVAQGIFGEQDLGPIGVAPATVAPVAPGHRWPTPVRIVLPLVALLLGAVAVADLASGTRRRPVTA